MRVPFFGIVNNIGPRVGFRIDPRVCMADILCFEETETGLHFDMRYHNEGASIIHFETEPSRGKPYLIGRYTIHSKESFGEFHMLPPSPSSVSVEGWRKEIEDRLPKSDTARSEEKTRAYWTDFSKRFQTLPRDFLHLSKSPRIYNHNFSLIVPDIDEQAPIVIKACEVIRECTVESLPEVWTRLFLRIHKIAKEMGLNISDVLEQAMESGTEKLSFLGALEILEMTPSDPKIYITPRDYD